MHNTKPLHKLLIACGVIGVSLTPASLNAQLCLNELTQSNIHLVYEDNEFPDTWAELYNPTSGPINLNGWKLGLTTDPTTADTFTTDTIIAPGGFILVYCDKEDKPLHTSFRIDSSKGSVVLFSPDSIVADQVTLKKMVAPEIAYGRVVDGDGDWAYLINPTPGRSNDPASSTQYLPSPVFSIPGGIYDQPFEVTVGVEDASSLPSDVTLCVTTDGREPLASDSVSGLSVTIPVSTTTSIRARLLSSNALNPLSVTQSYVFDNTKLPVMVITTNPEYLYSDSIGILHGVKGEDPNWAYDWRRPVNVELFLPGEDGRTTSFNQLGETRVKGNTTRGLAQKSMVVYANKRFGTKRFNTENLWPDKAFVAESKSFEIKSGGADFDRAHMRDPLATLLLGRNNPNVDFPGYMPAVVYFNAQYKGIYDVRERSNEDFVEANYDGLEDIDMVENWNEIEAGTIDELMNLYDIVTNKEVTHADYAHLIDFDNTLPYYALNIIGSNLDSGGGNNTIMWRRLDGDTRWRQIVKDVDMWGGWYQGDNTDYNFFTDFIRQDNNAISSNSFRYKAMSRVFMNDSVTSQLLVDHIVAAAGDYLNPEYVNATIDELYQLLRDDYPKSVNYYIGWGESYLTRSWETRIEELKAFMPTRRPKLFGQMSDFYGFGAPCELLINHTDAELKLNDIDLYQPTFDGMYFTGRALHLSAADTMEWNVAVTDSIDNVTSYTFHDVELRYTAPEGTKRIDIYVAPDLSGVEDVATDSDNSLNVITSGHTVSVVAPTEVALMEAYDISGRKAASTRDCSIELPSNGIYVIVVTTREGATHTSKVVIR